MDINDLHSFIVIARHASLRTAATELHQSPSALSKAMRRLEAALGTQLFDRVGKSLRLNGNGEHLRPRAQELLALAEQTRAEFRGARQQVHCRLAGPAILQWGFGSRLAQILAQNFPGSGIAFSARFEDDALQALQRDEADLALVTGVAINAALPSGLQAVPLGDLRMHPACGRTHPLLAPGSLSGPVAQVSIEELLQHDFACPDRSLFCGRRQGARSDGWRDDQSPRRIRFWLEDLQLLTALVRSGQALAYLPDFAFIDRTLIRLELTDYPYDCVEQAFLVWRPQTASGWQHALVHAMAQVAG